MSLITSIFIISVFSAVLLLPVVGGFAAGRVVTFPLLLLLLLFPVVRRL